MKMHSANKVVYIFDEHGEPVSPFEYQSMKIAAERMNVKSHTMWCAIKHGTEINKMLFSYQPRFIAAPPRVL